MRLEAKNIYISKRDFESCNSIFWKRNTKKNSKSKKLISDNCKLENPNFKVSSEIHPIPSTNLTCGSVKQAKKGVLDKANKKSKPNLFLKRVLTEILKLRRGKIEMRQMASTKTI